MQKWPVAVSDEKVNLWALTAHAASVLYYVGSKSNRWNS
jgi:hypothetical protein